MRRATDFSRIDRGFTLVEMIISIVVAGVVVGMVGMFGRRQIDAYMDVGNRAELSDAADTALRRIGRDLQSALPNSLRLDASGKFLEFVPVVAAGRYRADVGDSTGGNDGGDSGKVLDFGVADSSFQVLGPPIDITGGARVVVYNLGIPGSSVYDGSSSSDITGYAHPTLSFSSKTFVYPSPYSRFQIVATPMTYECAPPNLLRHRAYGFQGAIPISFPAPAVTDILVGDVAACTFQYIPAVLQRNSLVVIGLTLTRNGETVNLLHQVEVLNTP